VAKRVSEVSFTVSGLAAPARLDKVLRAQFPRWGRQAVGKVISSRQVNVNQKNVWLASWKVGNGDFIVVVNPPREKPVGPTKFDRRWIISEEQGPRYFWALSADLAGASECIFGSGI